MAESRQIRQLHAADFDACVALSTRSDPHSWSAAVWRRSIQNEYCLGLFGEQNLYGVVAFSLILDEVSLLNIVVDHQTRGCGYAAALLEAGLEWMQQFGGEHCVLEVRQSNTSARRLYERLGFREDGLRKNYYPLHGGREDAVLMSADLPLDYDVQEFQ